MTSVFCKDLNHIKITSINDNHYTCLKRSDKYNINIIYDLLNSQNDHKLKNLYRYIYLRTNNLKKIFSELNVIEKHKGDIDPLKFNELMCRYIDNNTVNEIIIVNSILFYYYPN